MEKIKMDIGPLIQIIIQGTSLCNLNCDYCYLTSDNRKKQNTLDIETAKAIFGKIFSSSIVENTKGFDINWHAGEPLTQSPSYYRELFSIIRQLQTDYNKSDLKITHSFQTNATLINDEWCELFKEFHATVGVSLDGPEFLHDAHRRDWQDKGSHARTMRGIHYLKKHHVDFGMLSVITKDTLSNVEEWFNFFTDNDLNYIGLQVEEIEAANKRSSLEGSLAAQEFKAFLVKLWELNKHQEKPLYIREFKNVAVKLMHSEISNHQNSFIKPFQTITIDSQGNFATFAPELLTMTSLHYENFIVGNFHKDSFESVIKTPKFKQIYDDILAGVNLCQQQCEYYELCGSMWLSNKYSEHGTFVSTETMTCRLKIKTLFDVILDDIIEETHSMC